MRQHKKFERALRAEVERIYAEGMKYPEQSTARAYWVGRDFSYRRVALSCVEHGETSKLVQLCRERLESYESGKCWGYEPKPLRGWYPDWVYEHPCFWQVKYRAEHQAYQEILDLMKTYGYVSEAA